MMKIKTKQTAEKAATLSENFKDTLQNTPLFSLYKATEKVSEKEKENIDIVNQLKNQLDDFKKNYVGNKQVDFNKDEDKIKVFEKNPQLAKLLPHKNTSLSKTIQDKIFWSKEKMAKMREKFRTAKARIDIKTQEDFNEIKTRIEEGDREEVV